MDVRKLYAGDYISAVDLAGRDVTLTIARLVPGEQMTTDRGTERKPVLYFREMEARAAADETQKNKRLVLNKTNAQAIAKAHGTETDEWPGKQITLFQTTCQAFGETVDCVRVRGGNGNGNGGGL